MNNKEAILNLLLGLHYLSMTKEFIDEFPEEIVDELKDIVKYIESNPALDKALQQVTNGEVVEFTLQKVRLLLQELKG